MATVFTAVLLIPKVPLMNYNKIFLNAPDGEYDFSCIYCIVFTVFFTVILASNAFLMIHSFRFYVYGY